MPEVKGTVGVPTMRGMGSAFGDYSVGAVGGLIYALSQSLLGKGFFGSLIAPILAGSVIKGTRGTALATVAGFQGIIDLLSTPPARAAENNPEQLQVM